MKPPIWLIYNRGGNTILIQRGKEKGKHTMLKQTGYVYKTVPLRK